MSGEAQIYTYTTINHIVDGAAVSTGAFSAASDVDTDVDNTTNLAPLCNLILTVVGFATAPAAGKKIDVYRRDLNIVSTNDEPEVDANCKRRYVGSFTPDAISGGQYLQLCGVPLPPTSCQFFLYNGTAYTLSANWDLDVQPYTIKPAT